MNDAREVVSKPFDPRESEKIFAFLKAAYWDYIAARVLLNKDLLLQGIILANTSLEKYFKAFLVFKGDKFKRIHDTVVLYEELKAFDPKTYSDLSKSFITLLRDSYQCRYMDSLENGARIEFSKREVLAQLDHTIFIIGSKLRVNEELTIYQQGVQQKDPNLLENNHKLNGISVDQFLLGDDLRYHMEKTLQGVVIEILHVPAPKTS